MIKATKKIQSVLKSSLTLLVGVIIIVFEFWVAKK